MPTKPWQKGIESVERIQAGRRGCTSGAVLIALVMALSVVAVGVMVPMERWQYARNHLPVLWEALRILLGEENPRAEDPVPPGIPAPPLPAPMMMPEQPLLDP